MLPISIYIAQLQLTKHFSHVSTHSSSQTHWAGTLQDATLPPDWHSVYCSFIFSLDLTMHRLLDICTLQITNVRYVETSGTVYLWRGVTSQKQALCKNSVFQTWTLRRLIRTKNIQTCIQFDILYTGCSVGAFSFSKFAFMWKRFYLSLILCSEYWPEGNHQTVFINK